MARSMWKGAIQFGLVTIPVKLYTATESDYAIRFNMLHETDLSRIQMKVWCPEDDTVISRGETVKGYEYAPGQYVVIDDADLDKVPLKTVRSIEIEQFAPRDDTTRQHAQFTKQAYYIEPDKIGRKAFYLLRQVLAEKELTAICKVVIRDREALAALDPFESTMLLTTLHWPDEIRSTAELDLPDEAFEFKPAELRMAEQLVEAMTDAFDPARFKDEYREALMSVIQAKIDGVEVAEPEPVEESTNLVDLMKLLQASVKAATSEKTKASPAPVSVADAKKERAGRAPAAKKAPAASKAKPGAAATSEADAEAEEAETKPARRRKAS
ncbi:MAG TPA: Ku protein [Candidatus Limnocylindrales bacterium]|nr:Ku protein [Candidatus Limnocylindrales bacterium]